MKTQINPRTEQQNRHLHWLFNQLGIDKDMAADIVYDATNGRTSHTSKLEFIEAMELIKYLNSCNTKRHTTVSERIDMGSDKQALEELDRKRKGVIAAIFKWGELQGIEYTMDYVKRIACQAAGVDYFNNISPSTLTRIYYEFCGKQQIVAVKKRKYNGICLN